MGVWFLVVNEWNVLRVVACLSIVLLHSTTEVMIVNGNVGRVGSLFVISLLVCILIIKLVSYLPFSEFMIGRLRGKTSGVKQYKRQAKTA